MFAYFECVLQMFVSPFSWYSFQGYLLNVYCWKKNTLLYTPKGQFEKVSSHFENHCIQFSESHNCTPSQILFYYNKLQGAGGILFSTKSFSGLTTIPSLTDHGNLFITLKLV